jgi:hypothetical protein
LLPAAEPPFSTRLGPRKIEITGREKWGRGDDGERTETPKPLKNLSLKKRSNRIKQMRKILYLLASVSEASMLLDEGGHFRGQALREVPVAGQQCLSANRRVLHTVKRDAANLWVLIINAKRCKLKKEEAWMLGRARGKEMSKRISQCYRKKKPKKI